MYTKIKSAAVAFRSGATFSSAKPKSQTSRGNIEQRVFLFFAVFCVSITSVVAQDVITLKSGDDIQALVQEVGEVSVKYKKFDNPNGPTYVLSRSNIFMIRYANGSKDVFTDNTASVAPPLVTSQPNTQAQNQQIPPLDYAAFTRLRRNDAAMESFLRQNDVSLYNQFHTGVKFRRTSKGLLVPGLILSGIGVGMMVAGAIDINDYNEMTEDGESMYVAGMAGLFIGQALIITSIPFSAVGGSLKKRAADNYEVKYYRNRTGYQPSLDVIFTGNSVGLALKF